MKEHKIKFMVNFSMLMIINIVVILLISGAYNQLISPQKLIHKNEFQLEQNKEATVFIMGDSHAFRALNPEYIDNSFNYALGGETYEQTYYKLLHLLGNYEVETIIIPLDPHSFSNYRDTPYIDLDYWSKIVPNKIITRHTNKSNFNIWSNKNFPFIGRGNEFKRIIFKHKTNIIKGWENNSKYFKDKNMSYNAESRIDSQFKNYQGIDFDLLESFVNIIKIAKQKGINVVIVKYPLTKEYLTVLKNNEFNISKYYAELSSYIPKEIMLIDYQNNYTNIDLFSDSDHLNRYGAKIISKDINEKLNKLK